MGYDIGTGYYSGWDEASQMRKKRIAAIARTVSQTLTSTHPLELIASDLESEGDTFLTDDGWTTTSPTSYARLLRNLADMLTGLHDAGHPGYEQALETYGHDAVRDLLWTATDPQDVLKRVDFTTLEFGEVLNLGAAMGVRFSFRKGPIRGGEIFDSPHLALDAIYEALFQALSDDVRKSEDETSLLFTVAEAKDRMSTAGVFMHALFSPKVRLHLKDAEGLRRFEPEGTPREQAIEDLERFRNALNYSRGTLMTAERFKAATDMLRVLEGEDDI